MGTVGNLSLDVASVIGIVLGVSGFVAGAWEGLKIVMKGLDVNIGGIGSLVVTVASGAVLSAMVLLHEGYAWPLVVFGAVAGLYGPGLLHRSASVVNGAYRQDRAQEASGPAFEARWRAMLEANSRPD